MIRKLLPTIFAALVLVVATNTFAAGSSWGDDYDKAIAQAKSEKKLVLADFTGSDWCIWCMRIKKDIFDKPQFKSFAKENLVLLELDFPQSKKLPAAVTKQNEALQTKYNIEGFPTLVLINGEGKEVARHSGYLQGGPEGFIAWVNESKK